MSSSKRAQWTFSKKKVAWKPRQTKILSCVWTTCMCLLLNFIVREKETRAISLCTFSTYALIKETKTKHENNTNYRIIESSKIRIEFLHSMWFFSVITCTTKWNFFFQKRNIWICHYNSVDFAIAYECRFKNTKWNAFNGRLLHRLYVKD